MSPQGNTQDEQNKGGEEIGQDVETLEREKRSMGGETTHNRTLDDMWMSTLFEDTCFNTLSHAVHVKKDEMCANIREKCAV